MATNVVFLTCVSPDGRPNITTVMIGGWVCFNPFLDGVSLNVGGFSRKCVVETKQYAICKVSKSFAKELNYCGIVSGKDIDKFDALKLDTTPGSELGMPIIDGCLSYAEYRVREISHYGSHDWIVGEKVNEKTVREFKDSDGNQILEPHTVPVVSYTGYDFWCLGEKVWDCTTNMQHLLEIICRERKNRL